MFRSLLPAGLAICLLAVSHQFAAAQVPLHQRIDELIAAGRPDFAKLAAPLASDEEFLRRVYLDLTGTIPPATEARAFLDDASPDKRRQLIDQLLAGPEHARHLAQVFDVMLMERRPSKNVQQAQWHEYLRTSFADGKPLDQLVQEILSADGVDPKARPAAKFYLDRDAEPHTVTKDISRLFLGRNFSCNQCHDSPVVNAYTQEDYYGIFAFLNRTALFTDKNKTVMLAEKADGEVSFESVFDPKKTVKTGTPRLPGDAALLEPKLEKGQEYDVAPANGVRSVPKFSRRSQLAPKLANRDNPLFKRTMANRLWAMMMGRGLVHPVDFDHAGNPPSRPELLDLLANELTAMNFDERAFLHGLALSQTYQRSSLPPAGVTDVAADAFAVARLKPLSPEQLAWSLMQATGLTDAERKALGKQATEAALYAKLSGNVTPIVAIFGSQPGQAEGQSFQATLDQALFLSNGALLRGWLAPRSGNLTDRLSQLKEPGTIAEELYLSILTRMPSAEEKREVAVYLERRGANPAAFQELAWALLTCAEFRFNH